VRVLREAALLERREMPIGGGLLRVGEALIKRIERDDQPADRLRMRRGQLAVPFQPCGGAEICRLRAARIALIACALARITSA
jgi:hypothetical protein